MKISVVIVLAAVAVGLTQLGCLSPNTNEVVVYAALDSEYSEPILRDFEQQSGVRVLAKFDVESTKTVGLTQAIIAESNRPRCDVFWNNEILNTLRLKERGLLEVHRPPTADSFPAEFRDPEGLWHGFAARARVLIVNTEIVGEDQWPASIFDLADSRWKNRVGIAKPLFGTTATHAACLFAVLGDVKAQLYFQSLKDNGVRIESGNKQVALAVAAGDLAFGLTDTDDALTMIAQKLPVAMVYPDRQPDEIGTLFIPNTLAIIKGAPHQEQARKLVEFLLRAEIERRLATGPSGQIPLHPDAADASRIETPRTVKSMNVDFALAAKKWDAAAEFLRGEFGVD